MCSGSPVRTLSIKPKQWGKYLSYISVMVCFNVQTTNNEQLAIRKHEVWRVGMIFASLELKWHLWLFEKEQNGNNKQAPRDKDDCKVCPLSHSVGSYSASRNTPRLRG